MKKEMNLKRKIGRIVLILVIAFGLYVGIDQIVFQCQKSTYVSKAEEYIKDLAAFNSLSPDELTQDANTIVEMQVKKANEFFQKYDPSNNMQADYQRTLSERVKSGYRWQDVTARNITVLSAWKSPFELHPHIKISYTIGVDCKTKGFILYAGDVADISLKSSDSTGIKTDSHQDELLIWGNPSSKIEALATSTSNLTA